MIKAVIFDWGGVLAPNPKGGWLNVLADMLNIDVHDALQHWRAAGYAELSKGLISKSEFWSRFEKSYGRTLPENKDAIWQDGSALRPYPVMMNFVAELRSEDVKVSILSNTVRPMSELARELALYESFDPVVLSDEVGLIKPDNEIYHHALNELQLDPSECIFVDDLKANLVPASDIGMHTVLASDDPLKTISDIKALLG